MSFLREVRWFEGKCTQCGIKLDREGSYCSRCNDKNNATKSKILHQAHSEKKCSTCHKPLDREGWFCKSCTNKLKLRARVRTEERRKNGLCVQCGNPSEGYSQCRECLDKLKERRAKKKS